MRRSRRLRQTIEAAASVLLTAAAAVLAGPVQGLSAEPDQASGSSAFDWAAAGGNGHVNGNGAAPGAGGGGAGTSGAADAPPDLVLPVQARQAAALLTLLLHTRLPCHAAWTGKTWPSGLQACFRCLICSSSACLLPHSSW